MEVASIHISLLSVYFKNLMYPNTIFVVHVPYARRRSQTNTHDYFFFLYGIEKFFDSRYERFL